MFSEVTYRSYATYKRSYMIKNNKKINVNKLIFRDLVHPGLSEPLRNQQMTTFKLVKLGKIL
jgi:hypothetical protein